MNRVAMKWKFFHLPKIVILLILLLSISCNQTEEVTSGVVGSCKFEESIIFINPETLDIHPGETSTVEVEVFAQSNCSNFANRIIVAQKFNYSPELIIEACTTHTLTNNIGKCNITVTIPSSTTSGPYEVVLDVEVSKSGGDIQKYKHTLDTMMVNVLSPFSLFPISPSLTVIQGQSAQITVNIYRNAGYNGSVNLSLENFPSQDATYSFDPVSAPGSSSTLTITAEANAVPDTYDLTIKGNEGGNEAAANLTLFIVEPFSPTLQPDSISIVQGQSGNIQINLNRTAAFFDPVTLSIEGVVIGTGSNFVDSTFNPNPTIDDFSNLTLDVGASVPTGQYQLIVKGTAGSVEKSEELMLVVTD